MSQKKNTNTIIPGVIREVLPNTMFRIDLQDGRVVLATPSGKMRRGFIRLLPGEQVKIEMTPYDKDRGRIVG